MNNQEIILVTGACGQIGTELCAALRERYGKEHVIASDRLGVIKQLTSQGPYRQLDVLDKYELQKTVLAEGVTQIYHLAAVLSASGEQAPEQAWKINMDGLLNVLETAREAKIRKIFWPGSIAVFGPAAPKQHCPQAAATDPSTVYGISKAAGEHWCRYYNEKYGMDIRSLRYPGLISHQTKPGGGTTDYAVEIFHEAVKKGSYTCFLEMDTRLPMLYMPDAIRAILELMEALEENLTVKDAYNLAGLSFTPAELARAISPYVGSFAVNAEPDFRQKIADSWPESIDDTPARKDWGWKPHFGLPEMTADMMKHIMATGRTAEMQESFHQ